MEHLKSSLKGKTYEEIMGVVKAKELKKIRRNAKLGFHLSNKSKMKISLANKGTVQNETVKEKQRKRMLGERNPMYGRRGKLSPHYGKKHSEETKKKISVNNGKYFLGKKQSKESNIKRSNKLKGRLLILEHIRKLSGKNNHNWNGGSSFEPYGLEFNNKFKRIIRKRDNQICMLCGIHREKLSRALYIHHINYDKKLTIPQNCVSLCLSCHLKTNYNREHWKNFFQSLLSERYNYQYNKNKEIVLEIC